MAPSRFKIRGSFSALGSQPLSCYTGAPMERVARNRRHWMQSALLGAACSVLAPGFSLSSRKPRSFNLGVASYSLRKLSRGLAIAVIKASPDSLHQHQSFHLPYETSREERRAARKEFEDGGLKIVGGGTIPMREDSDAAVQRYFDYSRDCGMPLMVIAPTAQVMPPSGEVRQAVRHQGGHPQPWSGRRTLPGARRCSQGDSGNGSQGGRLRRCGAHGANRYGPWCRRSRPLARGSWTCI